MTVCCSAILLKKSMSQPGSAATKAGISEHRYFQASTGSRFPGFLVDLAAFASCRRTYPVNWWCLRSQLRQAAQILDGCSQGELVTRTAASA